MSSDPELLKLAAKAAGVCLHPDVAYSFGWGRNCVCMVCHKDADKAPWNPLADDGDALRLAIDLKLDIEFHRVEGGVSCLNYEACSAFNMQGAGETLGADEASATRRAIVRAAAEIGRCK